MRLIQKTKLYSDKKFFNFTTTTNFPPGLQLELKITDCNLHDPAIEINGRITFCHILPCEQKTLRDFHFTKNDLLNSNCCFNVLTGDLVTRVSGAIFFKVPIGVNPMVVRELKAGNENINTCSEIDLTQMVASSWEDLEFLEKLRSLNPVNFQLLISSLLPALEATISKGSQQAFKKWAIADQIIRLVGSGKIPLNYLSLAAEKFAYPYDLTKKRLGIEEIRL